MPWIDEELVKQAKSVDLLTYLQSSEPHELVPSKTSNEFRTASYGSLVISNGLWIRNRGKIGGRSAVDFLIKVRGMGFMDAVQTVLDSMSGVFIPPSLESSSRPPPQNAEDKKSQPKKKWEFYPPRPERYSNKAVAYLQKRGISPAVINRAMEAGTLFESRYFNPKSQYHNTAVCVFAGKNEDGKIVYAAYRGIDTDMKQDKAGSDKSYNYTLPAKNPNSRHLAVFEAPVDLLSHATLQHKDGWEWDGHRLSLGGTSSVALISFLERNPQISRIMLHLDNDAGGLVSAREIKAKLSRGARFKHSRVSINPPPLGANDYNTFLLRTIESEREQKQHHKNLQPSR